MCAFCLNSCRATTWETNAVKGTEEEKEEMNLLGKNENRIDSLINAGISEDIFPGAVVAVVKDDKVVFLRSYGNRQVVPEKLPMTTNTAFDLASLSKCVGTTMAVMQLVEQGQIHLDDKVKNYLPDFKPWAENNEQVDITIMQLLSHSSGLQAAIGTGDVYRLEKEWGGSDAEKLMNYIAIKATRNFRPGTKCLYSCLNFITLQNIVEKISGKRLCDYVETNVFKPLAMNSSCYFPFDREISKDADIAATEVLSDGKPLVGRVHDPTARLLNGGNSGNAGVFSTAGDLALFCRAIMNGGIVDGKRVLEESTVKLMTSIPKSNSPAVGRALGWDAKSPSAHILGKTFSKHHSICHTGYTGTSIIMDLDTKTAVILLTNRVHPKDKGSLTKTRDKLADIVAESFR